MFSRSVFLVAILFSQQSFAQSDVASSLATIADVLQRAEINRIALSNRPSVDNTQYYRNVIGNMQQQMAVIAQNANFAVDGW